MRPLFIALSLPALLIACPQESAGPTYHGDIAPLFAEHCVSCHQEGGMAPFSLVSYDDAKANADSAALFTGERLMPPMTVDGSGECRDYQNARYLDDEEIALIAAWAGAGAPEGAAPPVPLVVAAPDTLDDANLFVEMAHPYTPKGSADFPNDDYRCFLLEGPEADAYVNGFEIVAGQPQEVHHMLLVGLMSPDAEATAQALDDEDSESGWDCFSPPTDIDLSLLAVWAPGTNVKRYPADTGLFVPGGRKLVMQIHYNLIAGPGVPDVTALKVRTIAAVAKEATMIPLTDTDMEIPAGERAAKFGFSIPLVGLPEDLDVYGVAPHMHQLGQTLRFELHPLGDTDPEDAFCMADVQRWDFHWQELFLYEKPIRVTAADVLNIECTYDTTSRDTPVFWGEGTQDEMCIVFAYVTRSGGGSISDLLDDL